MPNFDGLKVVFDDTSDRIAKGRADFQPYRIRIISIVAVWCVAIAIFVIGYLMGHSSASASIVEGSYIRDDASPGEPLTSPLTKPLADDVYAGYAGALVDHPGREPDTLKTIKISRYDPQLGGPNCFRWGNGTCLSPLANGERWEDNYGVAIAAPREVPFGTVIEIGGQLWVVKDRGGKVVDNGGVWWVDQLSKTALYPYCHEMIASVWYPPID